MNRFSKMALSASMLGMLALGGVSNVNDNTVNAADNDAVPTLVTQKIHTEKVVPISDNLQELAVKYNTTVSKIRELNNIVSKTELHDKKAIVINVNDKSEGNTKELDALNDGDIVKLVEIKEQEKAVANKMTLKSNFEKAQAQIKAQEAKVRAEQAKQEAIKQQQATQAQQAQVNTQQATQNNQSAPVQQSAGSISLQQFMFQGIVFSNGYKFSYYSQSVLPGGALNIPGRHVNAQGFVCDGDGYIVAANNAPKGTIIQTPFGAPAKVYDRGTYGNHVDIYIR